MLRMVQDRLFERRVLIEAIVLDETRVVLLPQLDFTYVGCCEVRVLA